MSECLTASDSFSMAVNLSRVTDWKLPNDSAVSPSRSLVKRNHLETDVEVTKSAGKRPPKDMKRLPDHGSWYKIVDVASWGDRVAFQLVKEGSDSETREKNEKDFYKPPNSYMHYPFQKGECVKVVDVGYSNSRNKVVKQIHIRSQEGYIVEFTPVEALSPTSAKRRKTTEAPQAPLLESVPLSLSSCLPFSYGLRPPSWENKTQTPYSMAMWNAYIPPTMSMNTFFQPQPLSSYSLTSSFLPSNFPTYSSNEFTGIVGALQPLSLLPGASFNAS